MQIQEVTGTDPDRIYQSITNTDASTITAHWPVFRWATAATAAASVLANEGGARGNTIGENAGSEGLFLGLAAEDIASGAKGRVQVFGYHESALIMRIVGSVTCIPGAPMGPGSNGAANSMGVTSTGALCGMMGPVVALDTVTATLHSLGTVGANFADYVFIRAL